MATNFKLWLDTAAPAMGSMSLDKHVGNNTSLTLTQSITDLTKGVGQIYMKVWADTVQSPDITSSNIPTSWSTYSDTVNVSGITNESDVSKQYYVHAMYMDSVANVSDIFTESTGYRYCTKKPVITVDSSTSTKIIANNSITIKYTVEVFDDSSTVTTSVVNTTTNKPLLSSETKSVGLITVTKAYEAGLYTPGNNVIRISVTDSAGNTTTKDITILYDSQETSGTLYFGTSASDATIKNVYNKSNTDIYLYLDTSATDIVSFTYTLTNTTTSKEVSQGTINFEDVTLVSNGKYLFKTLSISANNLEDGAYSLSGTYLDDAGITDNLTTSNTFIDTQLPTVTATSGNSSTWYVNGNTYYPTPHTVSLTISDPSPSYGLDTITLGSNAYIYSGTDKTNDVSSSYTLVKDTGNSYTLTCNETFVKTDLTRTLYIKDNAGNETSFTLKAPTWDETPPTISATLSDSAVTLNSFEHLASTSVPVKSLTVSDSGSGIKSVQVTWTQSTSQPTSWTPISGTSGDYTTAVNAQWSSTNADGKWYLWVKVTDNVGNTKTESKLTFVYDTTAPTGSISWGKTYTVTQQNTVTITSTDTPTNAGIKMKITSPAISDGDTDWVPYTSSRTVTFNDSEESGNKTISVQFKDAVGNLSSIYTSTIEYAYNISPVVTIMDSSGNTPLGTHTKVLPISIRISMSNDNVSICERFQLYGDFSTTDNSTASTASGTWTTFEADSGKNYMTVSGLYLSKNDGVKTVSLLMEVTDGLTYAIVTDSITLDQTPPQINVSKLSHNIISLKNEDRPGDEHTPIYKANTVTFEFTPNEDLSAYKVCVINPEGYADTAAASESAIAIGTANGSVNMSGDYVAADTQVVCTLKGADLQAHSVVNNKDGAYIVGVFGQDIAGVWSLLGTIAT